MAEWTGLEPATPGVTGRYSNQLNYHSIAALPVVPHRETRIDAAGCCSSLQLVGAERLELPTFAL